MEVADQITIDWTPPTERQRDATLYGDGPIVAAFWAFHKANPHVLRDIRRLAMRDHRRGVKRGMKAIFEDLRADPELSTTGSAYKLNNSYTALYSRLVMQFTPELQGHFRVRDSSPHVIEEP